jgi:ABC-2 type transport system permease protein
MDSQNKVGLTLHPIANHWARGFKSIYQRELGSFFRVRSWTVQLAIWLTLLVGLPTWSLMLFPFRIGGNGYGPGISIIEYFLSGFGSLMIGIGVILLAQGLIIDEKSTKTLAWVFSKPLSATGFILGKFAACAVFIAIIIIGGPGIVAFITAKILGLSPTASTINYLAGLGIIYLTVLFFLAMSIMMGTIFKNSRAVTGLSLLVMFAGSFIPMNDQLRKLEPYTVWGLSGQSYNVFVGTDVFLGNKISNTIWIAILSTVVSIAVFLMIAIWRIGKYEQQ